MSTACEFGHHRERDRHAHAPRLSAIAEWLEGQGLARFARYPLQEPDCSIFEGESHTESFLKLNPAGAVPVLELEDGRAIAESNAILTYLAEGTPYLPTDRYLRAKTMQWLFFEQYHVEPVIGSLRFWTLTGRLERNQGMVAGKREAAARSLVALERSLADMLFLVGDNLSIADIAIYAYSHRAEDCGFSLADYPALTAWLDRVGNAIGPAYPVHPYSIDAHSGA